jgi:hypothetical protein
LKYILQQVEIPELATATISGLKSQQPILPDSLLSIYRF